MEVGDGFLRVSRSSEAAAVSIWGFASFAFCCHQGLCALSSTLYCKVSEGRGLSGFRTSLALITSVAVKRMTGEGDGLRRSQSIPSLYHTYAILNRTKRVT